MEEVEKNRPQTEYMEKDQYAYKDKSDFKDKPVVIPKNFTGECYDFFINIFTCNKSLNRCLLQLIFGRT